MMTTKNRLIKFLSYLSIGQNAFEKKVGIANGYISKSKGSFGSKIIGKISEAYPELNTLWLLTGEGEMLKSEVLELESVPVINYERRGVPYYDVDFLCGFDLIENDQTINPECYIDFKQYNRADFWINASGDSMRPSISPGDLLAVKQLPAIGWEAHIMYGETYALVTEYNRTIKKVRKSTKGDNYVLLVPENKAEYDEQDVKKTAVRRVFQVLGCMKSFV